MDTLLLTACPAHNLLLDGNLVNHLVNAINAFGKLFGSLFFSLAGAETAQLNRPVGAGDVDPLVFANGIILQLLLDFGAQLPICLACSGFGGRAPEWSCGDRPQREHKNTTISNHA